MGWYSGGGGGGGGGFLFEFGNQKSSKMAVGLKDLLADPNSVLLVAVADV